MSLAATANRWISRTLSASGRSMPATLERSGLMPWVIVTANEAAENDAISLVGIAALPNSAAPLERTQEGLPLDQAVQAWIKARCSSVCGAGCPKSWWRRAAASVARASSPSSPWRRSQQPSAVPVRP